jgi:hypothetical protein
MNERFVILKKKLMSRRVHTFWASGIRVTTFCNLCGFSMETACYQNFEVVYRFIKKFCTLKITTIFCDYSVVRFGQKGKNITQNGDNFYKDKPLETQV